MRDNGFVNQGRYQQMLTTSTKDGVFILALAGEININSISRLREMLETSKVFQQRKVVINLARVSFLDNSARGYLVVLLKRLRAARSVVVLCSANSEVSRQLKDIGMDRYVEILPSCEDAIACLVESEEAQEA